MINKIPRKISSKFIGWSSGNTGRMVKYLKKLSKHKKSFSSLKFLPELVKLSTQNTAFLIWQCILHYYWNLD